jgi:hypothetical protein
LDRGPLKHERDSAKRMRLGLKLLAECLLHAGFNYSSDHHEASSWFTESQKVDQRISTIEQWERASQEAPLFILEVPFLRTGLSVAQVVERIMQNQRIGRPVTTADDLARLIVHHQTAPRRRPR